MEIVYFTLGAVTVLLVIGVAIMIRIGILVRTLQEDLRDHERGTHDVTVDLHRRIEDEVRELRFRNNETLLRIKDEVRELYSQNELRELHTKIDENEREIISLLDSEVYRLTNKINKQQLPKG
jgi:hypothetical protein